jgi:hypothetical protein
MAKPNRTLPYLIATVKAHGDSDKCILWPFGRDKDGYGRIRYEGRTRRLHRVTYALFKGAIPSGHLVCHSCDTPPCFNPKHLWTGTVADNDKDRDRKGRASGGRNFNPRAKLNPDSVRQLRQDHRNGMTIVALAAKYGIRRYNAWRAVHRKSWPNVT